MFPVCQITFLPFFFQKFRNILSPTVQGLLAVLEPLFETCPTVLKSQEIGNAYYGFRKMTTGKPLLFLSIILAELEVCVTQPCKC